ncbi:MAG TPA: MbnP family protein [Chitinophagaceae bacterium]|nr:MbnP family protein [Chitinophagaceae bacterium]
MKKYITPLIATAMISTLFSCRKDEIPAKEGSIKMEFFNVAGSEKLALNDKWYKNQNGDSFTVTKFNYYISNIRFNNTSGGSYAESESYHLVEQSAPASQSFDISKVPAGTYNSVTFTIGVDSLRNVSGVQSNDLDPAKGMFWSWSTGYIMLKVEGTSPRSPQSGNVYMLHAGGFKGEYNVLRTVTLSFPSAISVNGDESHIHLNADVQKVFGGTKAISIAASPVIMAAGENGKALADNYKDMFTITAAGK